MLLLAVLTRLFHGAQGQSFRILLRPTADRDIEIGCVFFVRGRHGAVSCALLVIAELKIISRELRNRFKYRCNGYFRMSGKKETVKNLETDTIIN
jgi:hypothetical protein